MITTSNYRELMNQLRSAKNKGAKVEFIYQNKTFTKSANGVIEYIDIDIDDEGILVRVEDKDFFIQKNDKIKSMKKMGRIYHMITAEDSDWKMQIILKKD